MSDVEFSKKTALKISLGHLLVVWDILANKAQCSQFIEQLTEDEKRAVWALQDLCEYELEKNGIESRAESEWNELMDKAKDFVKTLPVEFLD